VQRAHRVAYRAVRLKGPPSTPDGVACPDPLKRNYCRIFDFCGTYRMPEASYYGSPACGRDAGVFWRHDAGSAQEEGETQGMGRRPWEFCVLGVWARDRIVSVAFA